MVSRKSAGERPLVPPFDFHPRSNGEFCPLPPPPRARLAERLFWETVERSHRRLGMSRREFTESACGMAAALLALNQSACGSSNQSGASGGGGGRTYGGSAGAYGGASGGKSGANPGATGGGPGTGGSTGEGGAALGGNGGTNGGSAGSGGFDVDPGMTEDECAARELLDGDEFIFDVQVHSSEPLEAWAGSSPPELALDFIKQIFVQSDTTVACLTGIPAMRNLGEPGVEASAQIREIIERLAGPRLVFHANADPERGASELDYMASLAETYPVGAWKVYPHNGMLGLDTDEVGAPFVERARALGVRVIAAHRGLSSGGSYQSMGSPRDVVRAAAAAPDIAFLIYHSGWERNDDENHPYDPDDPNPRGVDRLVRAVLEQGLGPQDNVYAELGTTWYNLANEPESAAHVLGKLLKYLGPDRVVWGTDCVFNGVPQSQIQAFRAFVIPEALQESEGYPALTDDVRAKIFGLNAARVYGVDPAATRCAIRDDDVETLRLALRHDPGSVPLPERHRYAGPRTRREFLRFLQRERALRHG